MSKSIQVTEKQWVEIYHQLASDYSPSVLLIRDRMKTVLGFTFRRHLNVDDTGRYREQLHLDFYNEPKRTMFLLKYSEILNNETKS